MMAAPTLVQCVSTRATGTSALDLGSLSGGPTEGDLCVIIAAGANGALSTVTDVTYTGNGSSAGYTEHIASGGLASSGGTNRLRIWSKVLTSADYTALGLLRDLHSLTLAGWTSTGTARWAIFILRHASGWGSDRVLEVDTQTANVANGTTTASIAKARAGVMVTGLVGMSTVTLAYNGGSAIEPYWNDGTTSDSDGPLASPAPGDHGTNYGSGNSTAQGDLQAYDTGAATITIAPSAGLNNTSHAFAAIYFQVAATVHRLGGRAENVSDSRTGSKPRRIKDAGGRADNIVDAQNRGGLDQTRRAGGRADNVSDATSEFLKPKTAGGVADSVSDGSAHPAVFTIHRLGGRADNVTNATSRFETTAPQRAGGRADNVIDAASEFQHREPGRLGARSDNVTDASAPGRRVRSAGGRSDNVTNAACRGTTLPSGTSGGRGDTVGWAWAEPRVIRRAGGRVDAVTDAIVKEKLYLRGRAESVADALARFKVVRSAGGSADSVAEARSRYRKIGVHRAGGRIDAVASASNSGDRISADATGRRMSPLLAGALNTSSAATVVDTTNEATVT